MYLFRPSFCHFCLHNPLQTVLSISLLHFCWTSCLDELWFFLILMFIHKIFPIPAKSPLCPCPVLVLSPWNIMFPLAAKERKQGFSLWKPGSALPYPWVSIHPSEIWNCPSRPLYPGANTVNLSWLSCHLSTFPHFVAKLGIWPSVFFKPCDPDVEIKKELCYRIKQIQEALAVSASNTLKLQQVDQHGNDKNRFWERGKSQRKVMANPCLGLGYRNLPLWLVAKAATGIWCSACSSILIQDTLKV